MGDRLTMHHSRLAGFIIDCKGTEPAAEVKRLESLGARRGQARRDALAVTLRLASCRVVA